MAGRPQDPRLILSAEMEAAASYAGKRAAYRFKEDYINRHMTLEHHGKAFLTERIDRSLSLGGLTQTQLRLWLGKFLRAFGRKLLELEGRALDNTTYFTNCGVFDAGRPNPQRNMAKLNVFLRTAYALGMQFETKRKGENLTPSEPGPAGPRLPPSDQRQARQDRIDERAWAAQQRAASQSEEGSRSRSRERA